MIGRFFSKLFGTSVAAPAAFDPSKPVPTALTGGTDLAAVPPGAMVADEVEDRFYRLVLGVAPSVETGTTPFEQTLLRRLREAFGTERFDAGMLPRLPSVVPQLMRALRNDETDSRALAEQIARDTVLVGEVIRVANSALYRTSRPVTGLQQAVTLLGHDGLRRVVMQLVMRPILRSGDEGAQRLAGERLWEHAERCARACTQLGHGTSDPFEAFLAGLISHAGAQAILAELGKYSGASAFYSRPFVVALARQMERLSLHAARHWDFPSRVVQALAERRTRAGSRVAMLDVLVERGLVEADAVLLASANHGFTQAQLVACQEAVRMTDTAEA